MAARRTLSGIDILAELARCPQMLRGLVPATFPSEDVRGYSGCSGSHLETRTRGVLSQGHLLDGVNPGSQERLRRGLLSDGRPSCYSSDRRIERWSVEDVAGWLRSSGYNEVADIFELHGVDGAVLLLLDETDLQEGPLQLKRQHMKKVGKLLYKVKKSVMNRIVSPMHLGRFASGGLGEDDTPGSQSSLSAAERIPLTLSKAHRHSNDSSPPPDSRGPYATPEFLHPKPKKLIFAFMYLFMSIVATSLMNVITEVRVPDPKRYPPLPDLFLDNLPTFTWGLKAAEVCMLVLVSSMFLIFLLHEHRFIMMRRFCAIAGTGYFLRCLTMTVTSLSVPSPHLKCYDPDREQITAETFVQGFKDGLFRGGSALAGVQTCGDYMFSGHGFLTSVLVSFVSEYCPPELSWLRGINWIAAALGAFFILAGHEHYTVDVIIAFYIASRLFSYYHVLANGHMYKLRQSTRVSTWFPLLAYFEGDVDGVVPNKIEYPVFLSAAADFWRRRRPIGGNNS